MGLKITRKPGQSVNVYDVHGRWLMRVAVVRSGPEPELDFVAPRELQIRRDDEPASLPSCEASSAAWESRAA